MPCWSSSRRLAVSAASSAADHSWSVLVSPHTRLGVRRRLRSIALNGWSSAASGTANAAAERSDTGPGSAAVLAQAVGQLQRVKGADDLISRVPHQRGNFGWRKRSSEEPA